MKMSELFYLNEKILGFYVFKYNDILSVYYRKIKLEMRVVFLFRRFLLFYNDL